MNVEVAVEMTLFGDLGKRTIWRWAWAGRVLSGTVVEGGHHGDWGRWLRLERLCDLRLVGLGE